MKDTEKQADVLVYFNRVTTGWKQPFVPRAVAETITKASNEQLRPLEYELQRPGGSVLFISELLGRLCSGRLIGVC